MQTVLVKIQDLSDFVLDWAVSKHEGKVFTDFSESANGFWQQCPTYSEGGSAYWAIAHREKFHTMELGDEWQAELIRGKNRYFATGCSSIEASLRCYVRYKEAEIAASVDIATRGVIEVPLELEKYLKVISPVALTAGEVYIGLIEAPLSAEPFGLTTQEFLDGSAKYHLILKSDSEGLKTWDEAKALADGMQGELPNFEEYSALSYRSEVEAIEDEWYWTRDKDKVHKEFAYAFKFKLGRPVLNRYSIGHKLRVCVVRRVIETSSVSMVK